MFFPLRPIPEGKKKMKQFIFTSLKDPRAARLRAALIEEYDNRYGNFYDEEGAKAELDRYPAEDFTPPRGNFLLLIDGEETIGGGAFKFYDETTAELKRIWIDNGYRRQGLAALILEQLELQARWQGYRRLYLTTGFRQPEAVNLYLKNGYTNLFDLNGDWEAYRHLPFEKDISDKRPENNNERDNRLRSFSPVKAQSALSPKSL